FANPRHLRQHASEFSRRHVQNLGVVRCYSGSRERRCTLQHRHVSNEIALVRDCEFLFGVVPSLEDLYFAAQNNSKTDVALAGFVHYISALHSPTLSERFKQRKLMIVQFGKRDAFGVAIKLLVAFAVVGHKRTLRATSHNPNLSRSCCRSIRYETKSQ